MTTEAPARIPVNPRVLRGARQRLSLSVDLAVDILNKFLKKEKAETIDGSVLRSYEEGTQKPRMVEAEALARAYLIPFVALFPEELPQPKVTDFRLGAGAKVEPLSYSTLDKLHRFSKFYLAAKRISLSLGVIEEVTIPHVELGDLRTDQAVEELALYVRDSLGISESAQVSWRDEDQALSSWCQSVEAKGVFVFRLPMVVDQCRGASQWETGGPPAILLNSADATVAQLFTLAHEFAHLMFTARVGAMTLCDPSRPTVDREEYVSNRFAAALLLPRDLLVRQLPQPVPDEDYSLWPRAERQRLRSHFKVSHGVIGIRLQQLGIISNAGLQQFWRKPSPFVRGKNTPVWQRYRRYLGVRATRLAKEGVESEAITAAELSRILDIKVKDLESAVGL